jgi:hypothetical protein
MRTSQVIADEFELADERGDYDECLALCREGARLATDPGTLGWYAFRVNLGRIVLFDRERPSQDEIEEALGAYLELKSGLANDAVADRAHVCQGLALAYQYRHSGAREENLKQAAIELAESLDWYTRERDPHQWAATKAALGLVFSRMHDGRTRRSFGTPSIITKRPCKSSQSRIIRSIVRNYWGEYANSGNA